MKMEYYKDNSNHPREDRKGDKEEQVAEGH